MHTKELGIESWGQDLWLCDIWTALINYLTKILISYPVAHYNKNIMNGYQKERRHKNWTCCSLCFVLFVFNSGKKFLEASLTLGISQNEECSTILTFKTFRDFLDILMTDFLLTHIVGRQTKTLTVCLLLYPARRELSEVWPMLF